MNLNEWSGVVAFIAVLFGSFIVCWLIVCRKSKYESTSGDECYDRLVLKSILPESCGISFDKVAEELKGQDLGDF